MARSAWPGHADRWLVLVAATGMGLVVAAASLLAQALGWWGGHCSYALPALLQVSFWVLWLTPVMTVLLAGYRWLLRHVRRPRLGLRSARAGGVRARASSSSTLGH